MKFKINKILFLSDIGANDKIVLSLNVENCENVDILEHVVANISFTHSSRGDLKLTLVSPHGTPSEILSFRKNDKNSKGNFFFNRR